MDGLAEANQLLNTALEQLDDILAHGRRRSMERESAAETAASLHGARIIGTPVDSCRSEKGMPEMSSLLPDENGNGRDTTDTSSWEQAPWNSDQRRGSGASSGVESPPSDLPTSSASSTAVMSPCEAFLRAIEKREVVERPDLETQLKIMRWLTGAEVESPSPSMSTVSCPEYPELQDRLQRLAMARDSLSLQVSVLSEQVSAQKEKIRDLESLLSQKRGERGGKNDDLVHHHPYHNSQDGNVLNPAARMDLMVEVSNLKQKFANMEREKNEAERKLHVSQNEVDDAMLSLHHGRPHQPIIAAQLRQTNEEMEQLRLAVQRLMADNEAKSNQINSLRNALECQSYKSDGGSPSSAMYMSSGMGRLHQPSGMMMDASSSSYDFNAQLRKLLTFEDDTPDMAHSSSFPLSLCSSQPAGGASSSRSAVQSSSSFNSSLSASAASPPHRWESHSSSSPRYHANLPPAIQSFRSPASPAARQLAAELDELRRVGPIHPYSSSSSNYNTTSLPRTYFTKTQSTLALPRKKLSLVSSAGEFGATSLSDVSQQQQLPPRPAAAARRFNRWLSHKLRGRSRRQQRCISAPTLVESDDEIARGKSFIHDDASSISKKPLRRDRTRSSLRNLFSKLSRSTSHEQGAFRRGSAARSTSSARLGSCSTLCGPLPARPPLHVFLEWNGEQLAEWISDIGHCHASANIATRVRNGRHLLSMTNQDMETELGIRNPLHRKRLQLILHKVEQGASGEPIDRWDLAQVQRWLEEIGLPQYKDVFSESVIDGPMLMVLTAGDMVDMRITSALHYATIARSIERLRRSEFRMNCLVKKFDPSIVDHYPCPEVVSRWSHGATCEWLHTIDLAEFTPNLLCAGVPGAIMVYEPTFTAETLAEILQMPAHKTLLRRHLTTHFNQLVGQRVVAAKRDYLAQGHSPQLTPGIRIKIVRKGFSLTRKKAKGEICLDPEEIVADPPPLPAPSLGENGDGEAANTSSSSTHV